MRIYVVFFAFVAICSAAEGAHAHRFFQKAFKDTNRLQHYEGLAEHEIAQHVDKLLKTFASIAQRSRDQNQPKDPGCQCVGDTCGCCASVEVTSLKINATGCVNFTYHPDTQNISLTMTYNNKTLLNETVSLHNPPPLCAGLPMVATWCTIFYNITWTPAVGACLRYELHLLDITILKIPFGCYTFPSRQGETIKYVHMPRHTPVKRLGLAQILHKQKLMRENIIISHREML